MAVHEHLHGQGLCWHATKGTELGVQYAALSG